MNSAVPLIIQQDLCKVDLKKDPTLEIPSNTFSLILKIHRRPRLMDLGRGKSWQKVHNVAHWRLKNPKRWNKSIWKIFKNQHNIIPSKRRHVIDSSRSHAIELCVREKYKNIYIMLDGLHCNHHSLNKKIFEIGYKTVGIWCTDYDPMDGWI